MNELPDIDPAVYTRLATAGLTETIDLLSGLVTLLPAAYRPDLEERIAIYRGFSTSRKFREMAPDHPSALAMKGWILRDWAEQARQIKEKIERLLTGV